MPVQIAAADLALVNDLAAPIADRARRADFVEAVKSAIETAPEAGPGAVHRIVRDLQRKYFDPPADTRIGESQSRRRA